MSRSGATPEEAFDRLRVMSQTQHVKAAELSRVLVEEAVRRARSRQASAELSPTGASEAASGLCARRCVEA